MHDAIVVLIWTALEFLILKTWSRVAAPSFAAFLAKLFPPSSGA